MPPLTFDILRDDADSNARLGRVNTPHGSFDTPAFMPVGTQGTVKGILPEAIAKLNAQILLGNTYHLMLRPGSELIAEMGGLHRWIGWRRPILTDSGGFQVFSLSDINKITDEGVTFKSHLDGAMIHLTPERSIEVQNQLGADIIMAFYDCPPAPAGKAAPHTGPGGVRPQVATDDYASRLAQACERSNRWLERCIQAHQRKADQALFGIVQGGTDLDRRQACIDDVCSHDLPGFAIGGVAVGEGFDELKRVVEFTAPRMPAAKPRYLMGVGYERDIVTAVRAGVDMFDCVLPTRNGRNANAFTPTGQIRLRNAKFARDTQAIDSDCDCAACGRPLDGNREPFSRSYIRHLFQADEMLGPILVSLHNLRHFQRLLLDIRQAIADNDWSFIIKRWPVAFA